jgi:aminoglycoside 6'-N-acetyltransferase I
MMELRDMRRCSAHQIEAAAELLSRELWDDLEDARAEVKQRLSEKTIYVAALEGDEIIGFGGLLEQYGGNAYELHPLVVAKEHQIRGVGSAILKELEHLAREAGAVTIYLGTDDDRADVQTSLVNTDLYNDLPNHIRMFRPNRHPAAFYLKNGYAVVGVIPDANGIGKPDIFMAKRIARRD